MLVKVATYLDANAGAPLKPKVQEMLLPFLKEEGSNWVIPNPSSIHSHGRRAKRLLAEAREKIAASLGPCTDPEQFIFTSSGSEANQLVIRSVFEPLLHKSEKPHWITSPLEHDSNRQMVQWIADLGGSVSFLPVRSDGTPEVEALPDLVRPQTALASVAWVNNETGVITDLNTLAQLTRSYSIPLHVDAAQAWGKLPISIQNLDIQFLTLSAHKIGGLAGSGGLWLGKGNPISPLILGKQEKGRRGGTENLFGIMAMGAAAQSIDPIEWAKRVTPLRDRLQEEILRRISGVQVNGGKATRVANTLNLSFEKIEKEGLVLALDLAGYCVSSGSACSSGVLEPSHVLMAMGLTRAQAMAAIRVSLADELPWHVLEGFIVALEKTVSRVRTAASRYE